MENLKLDISEKHGIELITENDVNILSIGTGISGSAEIEMTKKSPKSHIIATTIDEEGLNFTKNIVKEKGLEDRIELKIEDVSEKMPYKDEYFDFIYARLVFHFLNDEKLKKALAETYRVLKKNGKFYIVVRSVEEWEAKLEGTTFDKTTGLTRYPLFETIGTAKVKYLERRLHSKESISNFLTKSGFTIDYIKEYEEVLYRGYKSDEKNPKPNSIIEICASKSVV